MVFFSWSESTIILGAHRGVAGINKGEIGQEKVHGRSQGWAGSDGEHDKHISYHSADVDDKEHSKYSLLHLWILCEPQENKLCHVVPFLHVFHEMVYSLPETERVNP